MTPAPHESYRATPLEIFCSYASDDQPLLRQLEQRLAPLQRQVRPGSDVEATLSTWASQAQVILLLVSPAYLADPECEREATQAMQQRSAQVIPVILRPCEWSTMPFVGLQCLPPNQQGVTRLLPGETYVRASSSFRDCCTCCSKREKRWKRAMVSTLRFCQTIG